MNREHKLTWNDITLDQYKHLREAAAIEEETDRMVEITKVVFGDNVEDLPLTEFKQKMAQLSFLQNEIKTSVPPKKLVLNGRKYFVDCLLGNITTAQYVDFTNHSKNGFEGKECEILSVFVIPEGHKYNDGYEIGEVINDIKSMPMPVVMSIAFFFGRQFSVFMETFQSYSIKEVKALKGIDKDKKKAMIQIIRSSTDLALYPLSSLSAASQTTRSRKQ